ncbi:MAG: hypothetical protein R3E47_01595 [Paracoccaceae bacterium]
MKPTDGAAFGRVLAILGHKNLRNSCTGNLYGVGNSAGAERQPHDTTI